MKLCLVLVISLLSVVSISGQLFTPKSRMIKKYHLMTVSKVNWYDALYQCRALGMNLVSIASKEEHEKLKRQIIEEGHAEKNFWTSGTRLGSGDTYRWMGSGKQLGYSDWAPGQPDATIRDNVKEACIHTLGLGRWPADWQFKFNDNICDNPPEDVYFICEQELIEYEYQST